jgi:hypothetical protein
VERESKEAELFGREGMGRKKTVKTVVGKQDNQKREKGRSEFMDRVERYTRSFSLQTT